LDGWNEHDMVRNKSEWHLESEMQKDKFQWHVVCNHCNLDTTEERRNKVTGIICEISFPAGSCHVTG